MNINDTVEVDLTSRGRLILYKYEIALGIPVHTASHMNGPRLKIQLWKLMNIFGSEMISGRDPCFEGNVLILPTEEGDK